jgi:hypothetical protein
MAFKRMRKSTALTMTELYDRDLTRASKRISNPGCYATNNQLLLAPLMPYLDLASPPSIFGVSGYSGAGTKSGQKDEEGRPVTLPKVVSTLLAYCIQCIMTGAVRRGRRRRVGGCDVPLVEEGVEGRRIG